MKAWALDTDIPAQLHANASSGTLIERLVYAPCISPDRQRRPGREARKPWALRRGDLPVGQQGGSVTEDQSGRFGQVKATAGPDTPPQRLGPCCTGAVGPAAASDSCASLASSSRSHQDTALTPMGLAVHTHTSESRGDRLRDTRVWVAGLHDSELPATTPAGGSRPPDPACSSAAAPLRPSLAGTPSRRLPPAAVSHPVSTSSDGSGSRSCASPTPATTTISAATTGTGTALSSTPQPSSVEAHSGAAAGAPRDSLSSSCGGAAGAAAEATVASAAGNGSRCRCSASSFTSAASGSSGGAPSAAACDLQGGGGTGKYRTSMVAERNSEAPFAVSCTSSTPLGTVLPGGAAGCEGGEGDVSEAPVPAAPLLSAYVAAMPSAGGAPPNEFMRTACKVQRSTSDGLWPPPGRLSSAMRQRQHQQQQPTHPGQMQQFPPSQQQPFRQQQQQSMQLQAPLQQQQPPRRQPSQKLPCVSGPLDLAAASKYLAGPAGLPREGPRGDASDCSDRGSQPSDDENDDLRGGGGGNRSSLRLPPLQPSRRSFCRRSGEEAAEGCRPRAPGHSLFTDSHDEFDGWQQHQQQQQALVPSPGGGCRGAGPPLRAAGPSGSGMSGRSGAGGTSPWDALEVLAGQRRISRSSSISSNMTDMMTSPTATGLASVVVMGGCSGAGEGLGTALPGGTRAVRRESMAAADVSPKGACVPSGAAVEVERRMSGAPSVAYKPWPPPAPLAVPPEAPAPCRVTPRARMGRTASESTSEGAEDGAAAALRPHALRDGSAGGGPPVAPLGAGLTSQAQLQVQVPSLGSPSPSPTGAAPPAAPAGTTGAAAAMCVTSKPLPVPLSPTPSAASGAVLPMLSGSCSPQRAAAAAALTAVAADPPSPDPRVPAAAASLHQHQQHPMLHRHLSTHMQQQLQPPSPDQQAPYQPPPASQQQQQQPMQPHPPSPQTHPPESGVSGVCSTPLGQDPARRRTPAPLLSCRNRLSPLTVVSEEESPKGAEGGALEGS